MAMIRTSKWSRRVILARTYSVKANNVLGYSILYYIMVYLCPQRSCILLTPICIIQHAIFQANVCTSGREHVD